MEFVFHLADSVIFATVALLWAKWSKLDIGLSRPAFREAEPWVLLYILWCVAVWAISIFLPAEDYPYWLERLNQLSAFELIIVSVVIAPVGEELLFRGAMFAAFLRRWGIRTAVIVPSLLWGLLHVEHEWWEMASIAGSSVLLAMARWKSGSVFLPLGLHATWNLLVSLQIIGWFEPVP